MIRILIYICSVIFAAGVVTLLASDPSFLSGEIFGQKVHMPSGMFVGGILLLSIILIVGTVITKNIIAWPKKLKRDREDRQRERGVTALARGLEAVAIGDATDASHHARVARRNLGEGPLTRLLTAQSAQLGGETEVARRSYSAMLEAPETEFIGLRGLFAIAQNDGDKETARRHAERAFSLRPSAGWAFESVFNLALDRGAWGEARAALTPARKNNTATDEWATRADAALLTAEGYGAFTGGDTATALDDAEKALKFAPGLLPAAILAARIHQDAGRSDRAARALEATFAVTPDINIVEAYIDLFGVLEPTRKAAKFERLAARHPGARAAQVARAHAHIENGKHEEAISILEKLIATSADAVACTVMAEAVDRAYGAEAARVWLERAATSAGKPTLDFEAMAALDREGWANLIRQYADHQRLMPPRLEAASLGMPLEEIRLLSKPPTKAEPETDETQIANEVDGEAALSASPDSTAQKPSEESWTDEAEATQGDVVRKAE